jgi:hypothetical protein
MQHTKATTLSPQVLFAVFKGPVRDALESGGFYDIVPKSRLFPTVHDAVTFAQSQLDKSSEILTAHNTSMVDEL